MMSQLIKFLDEVNGRQILVPTILVRNPFAGIARIIQVEHGGHRIHPQPVQMIFFQPEQGIGQEKIADLVASVVKDQRSPITMLA